MDGTDKNIKTETQNETALALLLASLAERCVSSKIDVTINYDNNKHVFNF